MEITTQSQVEAKRYKNTDRVPAFGDIIRLAGQDTQVMVGQLGGVMSMFQNCTFDGVFVLTHPEFAEYIGGPE